MIATVKARVGDQVRLWIHGQDRPMWVEVVDVRDDGFPSRVKAAGGRRYTLAASGPWDVLVSSRSNGQKT